MTQLPAMDFDVLFYDHLIKEEPKLVNKVFSAQRRDELEKKRVCHCYPFMTGIKFFSVIVFLLGFTV